MISEHFQNILDHYIDGEKRVSITSPIYDSLVTMIPMFLRQEFRRSDLRTKGSMGNGNKGDFPWISVRNVNISDSITHGLYIVYLFKKDMSGFYLTLDQGITYFARTYGRKKYEYVKKVVDYFQSHCGDEYFSKEPIDLGDTKKGSLGYGYEVTTILSKYYPSHGFNDEELIRDLKHMMEIYDEIYRNMDNNSYDAVCQRVIDSVTPRNQHMMRAEEAVTVIKEALEPVDGQPYDFSKKLQEVQPYIDKSTKYREITNPLIRKTDYLKKAKRDAEIGYLGEQYIMEYERERLSRMGLEEYADKVEWQSLKSDGFGYDIKSYDRFGLEVKEIYIEVKSTSERVDKEFPVSKGEVDASKKYKKQYFVYRVYNITREPKFYRVQGEIPEHFELDPITYLAKYKG